MPTGKPVVCAAVKEITTTLELIVGVKLTRGEESEYLNFIEPRIDKPVKSMGFPSASFIDILKFAVEP